VILHANEWIGSYRNMNDESETRFHELDVCNVIMLSMKGNIIIMSFEIVRFHFVIYFVI
jgi:hypothetical protein